MESTTTNSPGPDLPDSGLSYVSSVQYGNTFALIGGGSDKVFVYDAENEAWIVVDDTISQPKVETTAFLVDGNLFPEC